ncbi:bifunctional 4-hydroxy-2-oxoglutarate aldolase/2-dehydro-3-deoxy-phosphogluconate aldolase [Fodinibius sediminis]|uniref:2-dehydro-3-deoxy-phosphogluconate aldolase n=1 Tax=Fodinibius sediminis TaxID=1214077 RepID=A0A521CRL9_9BACT|nr:bifunctional 4-hydroxy-2-oxoglutarate aldolase/2-dehydro-3-deoxy-phosphogluconate aldolase [Fodinibius sediminis]SMO62056.1 2-dehydro-3-deoxyphosphogluconate aldolase / (4S)-4-hydroxy-2-oxoglutarate aldolase [Fodinibius sediminis]
MFNKVLEKKLLPAVTLSEVDSALRVAEALLEGGLNVMEVTFRTKTTAQAISAIAAEFPEMQLGAGTILSAEQLMAARESRAQFGLSPGINEEVVKRALNIDFNFIPGVMTPSEIELALSHGFRTLKLFPVSDMGGVQYIRSLRGPYQHTGIKFLPMGGISLSNLASYVSSEMVIAAGGSWLAPRTLISGGRYEDITKRVRQSLAVVDQQRKD